MVDLLADFVQFENSFWSLAQCSPPTGLNLNLGQDPEHDHYTYIGVMFETQRALDNPPASYPGTYVDYCSSVAREMVEQINKWGRTDEFDSTCKRLAFYAAAARYMDANSYGDPYPFVLANRVNDRLE